MATSGRFSGFLALACLLLLGAGPPEVVRVRVPAAQVPVWLPPGTEWRALSVEQLDALIEAARAGVQRRARAAPPRLLRARHVARWESGVLIGRSELVVEPSEAGPAELVLAPWTPAIETPEEETAEETQGGSSLLRVQDTGRTALRVEGPAARTITLRWQLRARFRSKGRGFTLGLPATDVSRLTLELPTDWVPDGPEGIRQGPLPGPEPGRTTWQFDGQGGLINLQLRDQGEGHDPLHGARIWVSGPTRIDLGEASASWTTEWTVRAEPRGPRRFTVELDPGLELIGVTGPAVDEVQAESSGATTRVTIQLTRETSGPTPVMLRAIAPVPAEGTWPIPAARPLDALWTGGTTSIRLDRSRVVQECRAGAGYRIAPRTGEPEDARRLDFEAEAPRSVATLVFRKPWADASVEVRGQLVLGNWAPRLESQLTWQVHHGRLLRLDVDLPPAWVPDRVELAGVDEPVAWHPEVLPGGTVRVHVVPPSGDPGQGTLVLNLAASATIAGGRGPLALPRVRPAGVRCAHELWLAWTEPGLTLQPTSARGLAWVDPRLVAGPSARRPEAPTDLREALAWRWIADQAEARVDRERVPDEPSGSIYLRARVDRDRLRLDWRIVVDAGGAAIRSIPLALTDPIADPSHWRFLDEATGMELTPQPLEARRRAEEGLPDSGEAWTLALPDPRPGRVVLRSRLEVPWSGRGRVPLLAFPDRFQARGLVVIEVSRDLRPTVEASGIRTLDPMAAGHALGLESRAEGEGDPAARPEASPAAHRWTYAFGNDRPGGRLELRTERLEPARTEGVIREAILTTRIAPLGASHHRLTLRVAVRAASTLDMTLPDGATLARVRRDGQAVTPVQSGRVLSIPLAESNPSRMCITVTLEYLTTTARPSSSTSLLLRPERPWTSWPCLAFCWEVVAPVPWVAQAEGPGLVATDPTPSPSWTRALFGAWRSRWGTSSSTSDAAAMLHWLDQRVVATRPEEVTLGEWFMRWDSGRWSLVIDRMALASAGWGPKSRVLPPRVDPTRARTGAGAAKAMLYPLGLTVVPVGGTLLITTRDEAPDRPGGPLHDPSARPSWEAALREASAWGADVSDRFQAVAPWRGEITPKAPGPGEIADAAPWPQGWRIWRFAATGWPDPEAAVRLMDEQSRAAWRCAAGLAVLVVGIICRNRSATVRAWGLAMLLAGTVVVGAVRPDRAAVVPSGVCAGAAAVLFLWLGQSLPRRAHEPAGETRASSSSRLSTLGYRLNLPVLVGLVSMGLSAQVALAGRDPDTPILALLPYEGPPDPTRPPDRVLLRLKDHERLQALAEQGQARILSGVGALGAAHRVTWQDARDVVVESEFTLIGAEGSAATWHFPVEDARNIAAWVDDVAVPVQVQRGGRAATVAVAGSGRHRLRIRRIATPRRNEAGAALSLPINPVASARVVIGRAPDGDRVEVPNARGRIVARADGVAGALGPVGRLEVRWLPRSGSGAERVVPAGSVEGLILWDAEPAGDHVRARLTYRNPEGTSIIRLALEPGLAIRLTALPGLVDVTRQGTPDRPEWVASVDPPLPDGSTVELELWRLRTGPTPGRAEPPRNPAEASPVRTLPLIEPLEVVRYSGIVAFRRPSDWSGRLANAAGLEPITEEAFVKVWGNLPEEPLTLSGTTRFLGAPAVALRSGPPPNRLLVEPKVQLEIGPGRIDMDVDAVLFEVSGWSQQVELEVPDTLRVVAVDADGLTDWSRSSDRVRLRFDGAPLKQRWVRFRGWLPVPSDPLATGPRSREIGVPWPKWVGVEARPGILVISSPTPFQLGPTAGAIPLPPGPVAAALGMGAAPARYRVDRPEDLGRLRWEVDPPRVTVQVKSQMTIHPDSAEWVALLHYDVSGGASDAVHLKLPTAWATSATLHVVGDAHQLASEARGATTFWTIRLERPIWGSQRLIVRSVLRLSEAEPLTFPDLIPLGQEGSVDTLLEIVNATGRELAIEGSPGLQPIDSKALFRDAVFEQLPGVPTNAYRVKSKGWALRVYTPGNPRSLGLGARRPRITLADLECTLAPEGAALGTARYEVEPRSGPFLSVALPAGTEPLWASVNNLPVQPSRAATGRWLIPLDEQDASHVVLVWRASAPPTHQATSRPVFLPVLDQAQVPILVTVRGPAHVSLRCPDRDLEPTTLDQLEMARADWLGRRTIERLARLDRSALQDREALVSALVEFELKLRRADRAAFWEVDRPPALGEGSSPRLRERVQATRAALADALATAALDEFAQAARVHLGLVPDATGKAALEIPEPVTSVRIPCLGRPWTFLGASRGPGHPLTLEASAVPSRAFLDRPEGWALILAALSAPVAAPILTRRAGRVGILMTLSLALAGVALLAGPWALGVALGMIVLGRFA